MGFISYVSGFQKSLSQLIGTIVKKCHCEKLTGVSSVVLGRVTVLVINVVKHMVFSICHFCCLFLYFVQLGETRVVGLLVEGFLVFALILLYVF